jgi:branched-chain amino acid transport system ATP-binding protein
VDRILDVLSWNHFDDEGFVFKDRFTGLDNRKKYTNMTGLALFETVELVKNFGALKVTNKVSLRVQNAQVHALIGPNGAGKSTLINQITGELESNSGSVFFHGERINGLNVSERARLGISRAYQVPQLFQSLTVAEHLIMAEIACSVTGSNWFKEAQSPSNLSVQQNEVLHKVGLLHLANKSVTSLAHGEKRQLEMAICLSTRPKLLVLDEPLAGLGPNESQRMIELLHSLKNHYGILLVEHDMEAVFSLADCISVLVNGQIIATGSVEEIKSNPLVKAAYLGEDDAFE